MADVMTAVRSSRAASVSSTGTATSGTFSFVPRYTPRPEPAYISSSAAAEHVTHRHRHENYDLLSPAASPTNDGAVFTDSALALLNAFLDSLLYNFLGKARSTSLSHLRPAILEILKARLGREALASADDEFHGLVDDDSDAEDAYDAAHGPNASSEWHLESAFKRMRLRVMVYIRLGDFDDEDEDRFLEDDVEDRALPSSDFGFQSSAPVYLASILEYLAEQTLSLAGDAAYARAKSRTRRVISENQPLEVPDYENVIVEDRDVEKIALDRSLGRLWRTWLKSYRGIASPGRGYFSRRGSLSSPTRIANENARNSTMRRDSNADVIQEERETPVQELPDPHEVVPEGEPSETDIAANIPLPLNHRDTDEIEVPGVAPVIYDEGEEADDDDDDFVEPPLQTRRVSFVMPGSFITPVQEIAEDAVLARPQLQRQRSNSVPTTTVKPWDWMPSWLRRRLAGMSNQDFLLLASETPLPVDEDEAELPTHANMADSSQDENIEDAGSYASATEQIDEHEQLAPETEENLVGPVAKEDSEVVGPESEKPTGGIIAGATAIIADAAAMAAVTPGRVPKPERQSTNSLDVQTKEVFEPEDVDAPESNRASKDQMPLVIAATENGSGPGSQRASKEITADKHGSRDGKVADIAEAAEDVVPPTETTAKEIPSVYKPMLWTKSQRIIEDAEPLASKAKFEQPPPRNDSKKLPPPAVNVYAPKRSSADSQKQNQTVDQFNNRPVDSPIKSASLHVEAEEEPSPTSPAGETTLAQQQTREGPPKPLPMTTPNPYAMLYDDVEPEAIGVAKTSNVPIHSSTPSIGPDPRPWTPNRGVPSVTKTGATPDKPGLDQQVAGYSDRRSVPSPLRPTTNEAETNGVRDIRRITQPDDYDLDRPINPERFQNWNRPKESPTLPRFFTQQASTPTEVEPRRGSLAHSLAERHSPKGSQGSTTIKEKREEEVAKERKFEALLDNKEPLKYTLTPEELRIRDSGPYPQQTEGRKAVPAPIDTNRASKAVPGAKSPSVFRKSQPPPSPKRPLKIKDIREAISALSPEPTEPRQRKSGLMARDARVYGGETKDFVDWIRTTGPTSEQQVQPIVLSHRLSQPNSLNSFRAKSNLVPREADTRDGTSADLLDLIRGGPEPTSGARDNRAPRNVMPFRSARQGNELVPVVNGAGQHSLLSRPSATDSFNSSAPLLDKNKRLPPTANTLAPGPLIRTRRKARDPYAIDSDSEDEFTALPNRSNFSRPGAQTENLQDFLRSTSPSAMANGMPASQSRSPSGQPLNFRSPANGVARGQPVSDQNRLAESPAPNGHAPTSMPGRTSQPPLGAAARFNNKMEARTAGATKGFNGHGYYYSTGDMADFLRTSGPNGGANGTIEGPRRAPPQMNGGSVGSTAVDAEVQGSKRGRSFFRRGVETGV